MTVEKNNQSNPNQGNELIVKSSRQGPVVEKIVGNTLSAGPSGVGDIRRDLANERLINAFEKNGIKRSHMETILSLCQETNRSIFDTIRDFGYPSNEVVARSMAEAYSMIYVENAVIDEIDIQKFEQHPDIIRNASKESVPISFGSSERELLVAISDERQMDSLKTNWDPYKVKPVIASPETIEGIYLKVFSRTYQEFLDTYAENRSNPSYYNDLLHIILKHGCYNGVSDIHLTPMANSGIIRLRIDGVLQNLKAVDAESFKRLIQILKQGGNVQAIDSTKESAYESAPMELKKRYSFRVQLSQTKRGEGAVIRILDRHNNTADFDAIDFDDETRKKLMRLVKTSAGLVLVTGPTGSGKTTTLYGLLKQIDPMENAIHSVENPVEYQLGLWHQHQIKSGEQVKDEGAEWMKYFKGLLRNDIDVGLLGEVRDLSTASAAIQLANTGHLVWTTLHTNSASKSITRISEMGINMPAFSDVILAVLAQRLVRKLCPSCKAPDENAEIKEEIRKIKGFEELEVNAFKPVGCPNCMGTGYRGRQIVYELLEADESLREDVALGRVGTHITRHLPEKERMWSRGLKLVAEGVTSLEEVYRTLTKE